MNKKLLDFLYHWKRPYLTSVDIMAILNKGSNSRQAIIKRAIKEGYLIPARRDLFLIKNRQDLVNEFEIASIIYGPSCISFESALSFHHWIPEAVRTTTSATVKRSTEFLTPIGMFSYE